MNFCERSAQKCFDNPKFCKLLEEKNGKLKIWLGNYAANTALTRGIKSVIKSASRESRDTLIFYLENNLFICKWKIAETQNLKIFEYFLTNWADQHWKYFYFKFPSSILHFDAKGVFSD